MSECEDCTKAAAGPHHAFTGKCRGCAARMVARDPRARAWRKRGGPPTHEAQRLLDQFGVTPDEVKAAAKADRL